MSLLLSIFRSIEPSTLLQEPFQRPVDRLYVIQKSYKNTLSAQQIDYTFFQKNYKKHWAPSRSTVDFLRKTTKKIERPQKGRGFFLLKIKERPGIGRGFFETMFLQN